MEAIRLFGINDELVEKYNCSLCGTEIKYTYEFKNKIYGCECIKKVTGHDVSYWIVENGKINVEATEKRERDRKGEMDEFEAKVLKNAWIVEFLEPFTQNNDFAYNLMDTLKQRPIEYLSERQISIIAEMYAKSSGKKGSKAYNEKYNQFYEMLK
ncbi:hypothetical protein [Brevibacillus porteri]|uniref:hypothetical protein n=1 Tax=Brevibacillus porteri TaxID=2126350 RepID=UPI003636B602